MNGGTHYPTELGPEDLTLDSRESASELLANNCAAAKVHLVEGSGPQISGETRNVLQYRLRSAALVLFAGFAVFLVWHLVSEVLDAKPMSITYMLGGQVFVTAVLGICAFSLCHKCDSCLKTLRVKELIIFGLPAVFFFCAQSAMLRMCAEMEHSLPRPDTPWLLLIFTYALFIPNTWRRAAVVIGILALAPVLLVMYLWLSDTMCAELLVDNKWMSIEMTLLMGVSFVSAVIGVRMINELREEAFEAKQLGQYKLGAKIGSGGMGEVYFAEHQLMKRPVAIKVIRPEKAGDPRTLARFEREVRSTAKLSHWNTIDIYDYGRAEDGTFYYVMEYLPGMSLASLVDRFGPLPAERVIYLLRQTCDALSEAHAAGLVHRDIKPANIFSAQRGGNFDVAKLLDFGMVRPMSNIEHTELTQAGSITGSPYFMSPEQATGESEPDARSDIYSMGVVAYALLTGQPPFVGTQAIQIMVAHAQKTPPPPSEVNGEVPDDLDAIVMCCLAKSPDDRFQTAAELAAALDRCESAGRWDGSSAAHWWRENGRAATAQAAMAVS